MPSACVVQSKICHESLISKRKKMEAKVQEGGASGSGYQQVHPRPQDSHADIQGDVVQGRPEKRKAEDDLEEEAARGDVQVKADVEMEMQDDRGKKEDEEMNEQRRMRKTIRMLKKMEKLIPAASYNVNG